MAKLELVIFDCDGVLVDSEYLSAQINAELLTDAGFPISANELAERYAGLVFSDTLKMIKTQHGISLPENSVLIEKSGAIFATRIKTELRPIDNVRLSIGQLRLPYCICSNSTSTSIKTMLTLTGLDDLFEGVGIFSAPEVGTRRSKPAPDVYLHAAEVHHSNPERVIVLEDSFHGVTAAKEAGMWVVGFTGARHAYPGLATVLAEAGAQRIISRHIDMPTVIEKIMSL
ncbi:MAG: putative phosphatase/phosphohexomutase [Candidatus Tokpelaia sp. JSC085]|nr:MAG: putative phosphatase/phosphohexomutase [Candidatus Tokpelaia sp. JSC085]